MYIHDLNSNSEKTILLIHSMLTNAYELKRILVDRMKLSDVRVIIPDLTGHGKAKGETYISSSREAFILHKYFLAKGISEIKFAFGVSLGSNVIFELLKYQDIKIDSVIMEGASVRKSSFFKQFVFSKYLNGLKSLVSLSENFASKVLSILIEKKISTVMVNELVNMSKESIDNMIKDYSRVDLPYLR
ncbi:MAG: alpha/beta hydrolase [Peptoniphilaceae bacterium]|nr:alpha/beta hydrolase [Peptoniphilaceae bacterium]MDY6018163.1 alpha/beta hydrolase [Anaerococcus sp.]